MTPEPPGRSEDNKISSPDAFDDMSDEELIEASRGALPGDTRAFRVLVRRYEARVRANCRYLTRSEDDSQDLAQEVLVKAFFARGRFEGRSAFSTWLWRIKANHCLNYNEKQRVRSVLRPWSEHEYAAASTPAKEPLASETHEVGDTAARVRSVIDRMPDTLRVALILRDLDGLPYAELAEQLDISLSAAKMRVKRARDEFRVEYVVAEGAP